MSTSKPNRAKSPRELRKNPSRSSSTSAFNATKLRIHSSSAEQIQSKLSRATPIPTRQSSLLTTSPLYFSTSPRNASSRESQLAKQAQSPSKSHLKSPNPLNPHQNTSWDDDLRDISTRLHSENLLNLQRKVQHRALRQKNTKIVDSAQLLRRHAIGGKQFSFLEGPLLDDMISLPPDRAYQRFGKEKFKDESVGGINELWLTASNTHLNNSRSHSATSSDHEFKNLDQDQSTTLPIFEEAISKQFSLDRVSQRILRFRKYAINRYFQRRKLLSTRHISVLHSIRHQPHRLTDSPQPLPSTPPFPTLHNGNQPHFPHLHPTSADLSQTDSSQHTSNAPDAQPELTLDATDLHSLFNTLPQYPSKSFLQYDNSDNLLSALKTITVSAQKCTPLSPDQIKLHFRPDDSVVRAMLSGDDNDDDSLSDDPHSKHSQSQERRRAEKRQKRDELSKVNKMNTFFTSKSIPWATRIHFAHQKHEYPRVLRLFEYEMMPILTVLSEKLWICQSILSLMVKYPHNPHLSKFSHLVPGSVEHFDACVEQIMTDYPQFADIVELLVPHDPFEHFSVVQKQYNALISGTFRDQFGEQGGSNNPSSNQVRNQSKRQFTHLATSPFYEFLQTNYTTNGEYGNIDDLPENEEQKEQLFNIFHSYLRKSQLSPLLTYHPLLLPTIHDVNDSISLEEQRLCEEQSDDGSRTHPHHQHQHNHPQDKRLKRVVSAFGQFYTGTAQLGEFVKLLQKHNISELYQDLFLEELSKDAVTMEELQASKDLKKRSKTAQPGSSSNPSEYSGSAGIVPSDYADGEEVDYQSELFMEYLDDMRRSDAFQFQPVSSLIPRKPPQQSHPNATNLDNSTIQQHSGAQTDPTQSSISPSTTTNNNNNNNNTIGEPLHPLYLHPHYSTLMECSQVTKFALKLIEHCIATLNKTENAQSLPKFLQAKFNLVRSQYSIPYSTLDQTNLNPHSPQIEHPTHPDTLAQLSNWLHDEHHHFQQIRRQNDLEITDFTNLLQNHVIPRSPTHQRVSTSQYDLKSKDSHDMLKYRRKQTASDLESDFLGKFDVTRNALFQLLQAQIASHSQQDHTSTRDLFDAMRSRHAMRTTDHKTRSAFQLSYSDSDYVLRPTTTQQQLTSDIESDLNDQVAEGMLLDDSNVGVVSFSRLFFSERLYADYITQYHSAQRRFNKQHPQHGAIAKTQPHLDPFTAAPPSQTTTQLPAKVLRSQQLAKVLKIETNFVLFPFTIQDPKMALILSLSFTKLGLEGVATQIIDAHLRGSYLTDVMQTSVSTDSVNELRKSSAVTLYRGISNEVFLKTILAKKGQEERGDDGIHLNNTTTRRVVNFTGKSPAQILAILSAIKNHQLIETSNQLTNKDTNSVDSLMRSTLAEKNDILRLLNDNEAIVVEIEKELDLMKTGQRFESLLQAQLRQFDDVIDKYNSSMFTLRTCYLKTLRKYNNDQIVDELKNRADFVKNGSNPTTISQQSDDLQTENIHSEAVDAGIDADTLEQRFDEIIGGQDIMTKTFQTEVENLTKLKNRITKMQKVIKAVKIMGVAAAQQEPEEIAENFEDDDSESTQRLDDILNDDIDLELENLDNNENKFVDSMLSDLTHSTDSASTLSTLRRKLYLLKHRFIPLSQRYKLQNQLLLQRMNTDRVLLKYLYTRPLSISPHLIVFTPPTAGGEISNSTNPKSQMRQFQIVLDKLEQPGAPNSITGHGILIDAIQAGLEDETTTSHSDSQEDEYILNKLIDDGTARDQSSRSQRAQATNHGLKPTNLALSPFLNHHLSLSPAAHQSFLLSQSSNFSINNLQPPPQSLLTYHFMTARRLYQFVRAFLSLPHYSARQIGHNLVNKALCQSGLVTQLITSAESLKSLQQATNHHLSRAKSYQSHAQQLLRSGFHADQVLRQAIGIDEDDDGTVDLCHLSDVDIDQINITSLLSSATPAQSIQEESHVAYSTGMEQHALSALSYIIAINPAIDIDHFRHTLPSQTSNSPATADLSENISAVLQHWLTTHLESHSTHIAVVGRKIDSQPDQTSQPDDVSNSSDGEEDTLPNPSSFINSKPAPNLESRNGDVIAITSMTASRPYLVPTSLFLSYIASQISHFLHIRESNKHHILTQTHLQSHHDLLCCAKEYIPLLERYLCLSTSPHYQQSDKFAYNPRTDTIFKHQQGRFDIQSDDKHISQLLQQLHDANDVDFGLFSDNHNQLKSSHRTFDQAVHAMGLGLSHPTLCAILDIDSTQNDPQSMTRPPNLANVSSKHSKSMWQHIDTGVDPDQINDEQTTLFEPVYDGNIFTPQHRATMWSLVPFEQTWSLQESKQPITQSSSGLFDGDGVDLQNNPTVYHPRFALQTFLQSCFGVTDLSTFLKQNTPHPETVSPNTHERNEVNHHVSNNHLHKVNQIASIQTQLDQNSSKLSLSLPVYTQLLSYYSEKRRNVIKISRIGNQSHLDQTTRDQLSQCQQIIKTIINAAFAAKVPLVLQNLADLYDPLSSQSPTHQSTKHLPPPQPLDNSLLKEDLLTYHHQNEMIFNHQQRGFENDSSFGQFATTPPSFDELAPYLTAIPLPSPTVRKIARHGDAIFTKVKVANGLHECVDLLQTRQLSAIPTHLNDIFYPLSKEYWNQVVNAGRFTDKTTAYYLQPHYFDQSVNFISTVFSTLVMSSGLLHTSTKKFPNGFAHEPAATHTYPPELRYHHAFLTEFAKLLFRANNSLLSPSQINPSTISALFSTLFHQPQSTLRYRIMWSRIINILRIGVLSESQQRPKVQFSPQDTKLLSSISSHLQTVQGFDNVVDGQISPSTEVDQTSNSTPPLQSQFDRIITAIVSTSPDTFTVDPLHGLSLGELLQPYTFEPFAHRHATSALGLVQTWETHKENAIKRMEELVSKPIPVNPTANSPNTKLVHNLATLYVDIVKSQLPPKSTFLSNPEELSALLDVLQHPENILKYVANDVVNHLIILNGRTSGEIEELTSTLTSNMSATPTRPLTNPLDTILSEHLSTAYDQNASEILNLIDQDELYQHLNNMVNNSTHVSPSTITSPHFTIATSSLVYRLFSTTRHMRRTVQALYAPVHANRHTYTRTLFPDIFQANADPQAVLNQRQSDSTLVDFILNSSDPSTHLFSQPFLQPNDQADPSSTMLNPKLVSFLAASQTLPYLYRSRDLAQITPFHPSQDIEEADTDDSYSARSSPKTSKPCDSQVVLSLLANSVDSSRESKNNQPHDQIPAELAPVFSAFLHSIIPHTHNPTNQPSHIAPHILRKLYTHLPNNSILNHIVGQLNVAKLALFRVALQNAFLELGDDNLSFDSKLTKFLDQQGFFGVVSTDGAEDVLVVNGNIHPQPHVALRVQDLMQLQLQLSNELPIFLNSDAIGELLSQISAISPETHTDSPPTHIPQQINLAQSNTIYHKVKIAQLTRVLKYLEINTSSRDDQIADVVKSIRKKLGQIHILLNPLDILEHINTQNLPTILPYIQHCQIDSRQLTSTDTTLIQSISFDVYSPHLQSTAFLSKKASQSGHKAHIDSPSQTHINSSTQHPRADQPSPLPLPISISTRSATNPSTAETITTTIAVKSGKISSDPFYTTQELKTSLNSFKLRKAITTYPLENTSMNSQASAMLSQHLPFLNQSLDLALKYIASHEHHLPPQPHVFTHEHLQSILCTSAFNSEAILKGLINPNLPPHVNSQLSQFLTCLLGILPPPDTSSMSQSPPTPPQHTISTILATFHHILYNFSGSPKSAQIATSLFYLRSILLDLLFTLEPASLIASPKLPVNSFTSPSLLQVSALNAESDGKSMTTRTASEINFERHLMLISDSLAILQEVKVRIQSLIIQQTGYVTQLQKLSTPLPQSRDDLTALGSAHITVYSRPNGLNPIKSDLILINPDDDSLDLFSNVSKLQSSISDLTQSLQHAAQHLLNLISKYHFTPTDTHMGQLWDIIVSELDLGFNPNHFTAMQTSTKDNHTINIIPKYTIQSVYHPSKPVNEMTPANNHVTELFDLSRDVDLKQLYDTFDSNSNQSFENFVQNKLDSGHLIKTQVISSLNPRAEDFETRSQLLRQFTSSGLSLQLGYLGNDLPLPYRVIKSKYLAQQKRLKQATKAQSDVSVNDQQLEWSDVVLDAQGMVLPRFSLIKSVNEVMFTNALKVISTLRHDNATLTQSSASQSGLTQTNPAHPTSNMKLESISELHMQFFNLLFFAKINNIPISPFNQRAYTRLTAAYKHTRIKNQAKTHPNGLISLFGSVFGPDASSIEDSRPVSQSAPFHTILTKPISTPLKLLLLTTAQAATKTHSLKQRRGLGHLPCHYFIADHLHKPNERDDRDDAQTSQDSEHRGWLSSIKTTLSTAPTAINSITPHSEQSGKSGTSKKQPLSGEMGIIPVGLHSTLHFSKPTLKTVQWNAISLQSFPDEQRLLLETGQLSAFVGSTHVELLTIYQRRHQCPILVVSNPGKPTMSIETFSKTKSLPTDQVSPTKTHFDSARPYDLSDDRDWVQFVGEKYTSVLTSLLHQISPLFRDQSRSPHSHIELTAEEINTLTSQVLTTYTNLVQITLDQPLVDSQAIKILSRDADNSTSKDDDKFEKVYKKFASKHTHIISPSFWSALQHWLLATSADHSSSGTSNHHDQSSLTKPLHHVPSQPRGLPVHSILNATTLMTMNTVASGYMCQKFNPLSLAVVSKALATSDPTSTIHHADTVHARLVSTMQPFARDFRDFMTNTSQLLSTGFESDTFYYPLAQLLMTQLIIENSGYTYLPPLEAPSQPKPKQTKKGSPQNNNHIGASTPQEMILLRGVHSTLEGNSLQDRHHHLTSYLRHQILHSPSSSQIFSSTSTPQTPPPILTDHADTAKPDPNPNPGQFFIQTTSKQPHSVLFPSISSITTLAQLDIDPTQLSPITSRANGQPAVIYQSPLKHFRKTNQQAAWIDNDSILDTESISKLMDAKGQNQSLPPTLITLNDLNSFLNSPPSSTTSKLKSLPLVLPTHDHISLSNTLHFIRDLIYMLDAVATSQTSLFEIVSSPSNIYTHSTPITTDANATASTHNASPSQPALITGLSHQSSTHLLTPSQCQWKTIFKQAKYSLLTPFFSKNILHKLPQILSPTTYLTLSDEEQRYKFNAFSTLHPIISALSRDLINITTTQSAINIIALQLSNQLQKISNTNYVDHKGNNLQTRLNQIKQQDNKLTTISVLQPHLLLTIAQNNVLFDNFSTNIKHFASIKTPPLYKYHRQGTSNPSASRNFRQLATELDRIHQCDLFTTSPHKSLISLITPLSVSKRPHTQLPTSNFGDDKIYSISIPVPSNDLLTSSQFALHNNYTSNVDIYTTKVFVPVAGRVPATLGGENVDNNPRHLSDDNVQLAESNSSIDGVISTQLPIVANALITALSTINTTLSTYSPLHMVSEPLVSDSQLQSERFPHTNPMIMLAMEHALAKRAQLASLYTANLITNHLLSSQHSTIQHAFRNQDTYGFQSQKSKWAKPQRQVDTVFVSLLPNLASPAQTPLTRDFNTLHLVAQTAYTLSTTLATTPIASQQSLLKFNSPCPLTEVSSNHPFNDPILPSDPAHPVSLLHNHDNSTLFNKSYTSVLSTILYPRDVLQQISLGQAPTVMNKKQTSQTNAPRPKQLIPNSFIGPPFPLPLIVRPTDFLDSQSNASISAFAQTFFAQLLPNLQTEQFLPQSYTSSTPLSLKHSELPPTSYHIPSHMYPDYLQLSTAEYLIKTYLNATQSLLQFNQFFGAKKALTQAAALSQKAMYKKRHQSFMDRLSQSDPGSVPATTPLPSSIHDNRQFHPTSHNQIDVYSQFIQQFDLLTNSTPHTNQQADLGGTLVENLDKQLKPQESADWIDLLAPIYTVSSKSLIVDTELIATSTATRNTGVIPTSQQPAQKAELIDNLEKSLFLPSTSPFNYTQILSPSSTPLDFNLQLSNRLLNCHMNAGSNNLLFKTFALELFTHATASLLGQDSQITTLTSPPPSPPVDLSRSYSGGFATALSQTLLLSSSTNDRTKSTVPVVSTQPWSHPILPPSQAQSVIELVQSQFLSQPAVAPISSRLIEALFFQSAIDSTLSPATTASRIKSYMKPRRKHY